MNRMPTTDIERFEIVLDEQDFDPAVRGALQAKQAGNRVLGGDVLGGDEARRRLIDAMPKAIASRLEKIVPANFKIKEIELAIRVKGSPFGMGLEGDIKVKLTPE